MNFNPRTPDGVRRAGTGDRVGIFAISIHAPLTGCDFIFSSSPWLPEKFQSTHP